MKKTVYVKRRKKLDFGEHVERHFLATINDESDFENLINDIICRSHSRDGNYFEIPQAGDSMMTQDYVLFLYDRKDENITDLKISRVKAETILNKEIHYA